MAEYVLRYAKPFAATCRCHPRLYHRRQQRCIELPQSETASPPTATPLPTGNNGRARRLVILGGANGARSLNESIPSALALLGGKMAGWQEGALDKALARELEPLVTGDQHRHQMAQAMQGLAKPQAAEAIAEAIATNLCGRPMPNRLAA